MKHLLLFAFAALGLVPVAHAQSLVLWDGDRATVSGAGTVGTIGGKGVASRTTAYSGSDSGASILGSIVFTLGTGGSITTGNWGSGLVAEDAGSRTDGSGSIAIAGGSITAGDSGYGVDALLNFSPITITGGSIRVGNGSTGLRARYSWITMTGGSIRAGKNGDGLKTSGSGPVTISGGSISVGPGGRGVYAIGDLDSEGSSHVIITGGTITAGEHGYGLVAKDRSTIDLYGKFDGLRLGQTKTLPSSGTTGSFTGTLQKNTLPQTFTYQNYARIRLHDVASSR